MEVSRLMLSTAPANMMQQTNVTGSPVSSNELQGWPTISSLLERQLLQSFNMTNIDNNTLQHLYHLLMYYNLTQNISQSDFHQNPHPSPWHSLFKNLISELHNQSIQDTRSLGVQDSENTLYQMTPEVVIVLSVFYGSISLVAVIGNALVMWVVATSRMLHSVTNYFIANLALADIIIGLFSIPFQVSRLINK